MSENANDEEKLAEETTVNTEAETQETVGGGMQTEPAVEAQSDGTAAAKKPNKFVEKLDKFFGISKSGSSVKTEVIGGLTTFMAMVYILMVNADMFTATGVSYGAVYIATALSAVIGTILMALVARLPMAQASGMGLNAFFVFTICLGSKLSYANALVLILIEGVVFIILTATGLRKMLFNAIPKAVRVAIPAGIGLFIAFIGFAKRRHSGRRSFHARVAAVLELVKTYKQSARRLDRLYDHTPYSYHYTCRYYNGGALQKERKGFDTLDDARRGGTLLGSHGIGLRMERRDMSRAFQELQNDGLQSV